MLSTENLISIHRQDMAFLRTESRQARLDRTRTYREMNKEFKTLRDKLASEMPKSGRVASLFRAPITFMVVLIGILSF